MQPMPAKNRTAVAVGAALLVVVVGGFALWSANRNNQPVPQDQSVVDETTTTDQSAMSTSPTGSETDLTAPITAAPGTEATSATTTTTTTQPAASIPETYVVQPGDTLSSISAHFFGDSKYYGDIEAANNLEDPGAILPGMTLNLPKLSDLRAAQAQTAAPAQANTTAPATTSTTPTNTTPAPGDALAH